MRQYMSDIYLSTVVMDYRDQPELIPADIENGKLADLVHRPENPLEIGERAEIGL